MRLVLLLLILIGSAASAQQVAIIKKGRVITRFNLGDPMRYVSKVDGEIHNVAILSIQEFSFVTLQKDTVKYSDVAKIKFRNKGIWKYVKSTLIGSAALEALHFALKPAFGGKNPQAVNGLQYAAGAGIVSVAFALATSRTQVKLNGFKRLKFINYDSPLYK